MVSIVSMDSISTMHMLTQQLTSNFTWMPQLQEVHD